MINNSPSQDFPFTGYRYHRKETNLADLWSSFITSQRQAAEHAEKVGLYKYGSVSGSWVERNELRNQIEREEI